MEINKIGIIGLGYVGLPLQLNFQRKIKLLDLILIRFAFLNYQKSLTKLMKQI